MSPLERCFLRRNGVILGPFSAERLQGMLQTGEIDAHDELSADKSSWQSVQDAFAELYPEEELGAPEAAVEVEQEPETAPEIAPVSKACDIAEAEPAAKTAAKTALAVIPENPWKTIFGDVIRLLWYAADAQTKLRGHGKKYAVRAGWLAVLLAVLLTAFGNALFASRYAVGCRYLWIAGYAVLLGTLLLSYCVTTGVGGDVLMSGAITLEIAGFHVVNMALLFLPGTDWCTGQLRLAFPFFLYLLLGAMLAWNAVAVMRRRLMEYGIAAYPAGAAGLVWSVTLFYGYMEGIAIPVMQGVMA